MPISSINGEPIVVEAVDEINYLIDVFTEPTRNLNDKILGRWYAKSSGEIVFDAYDTHVGMKEPIPCNPSTVYTISCVDIAGTVYWDFYDSNMTFISASNAGSGVKTSTVTTPETCAYLYAFYYRSGGNDLNDDSAIQIEQGANATAYVPPLTAIDMDARDGVADLDARYDANTEPTRNLNTADVGRYSLRANGEIYESGYETVFGMSHTVPVTPSGTYTFTMYNITFNGTGMILIGEYDADGNFLNRTQVSSFKDTTTFTVSDNTYYAAAQVYKSSGITIDESSKMQIELGATSTAYVPPYTLIDYVAREGTTASDIPSYFTDNVSQAIARVRANMLSVGRNGDTFVFVTDCHWRNNSQHSPALIRRLLEATNVRLVINGGDNLQGHLNPKASAAAEILECVNAMRFEDMGVRSIGVMGNHDNNRNNNSDNPNEYISAAEQYSIINKAYEGNDLHYGSGNWYYYDNDACKVRYFMLDWGADSAAQTSWVAETMGALPDGYKAVVVVHGIYRTTSGDETHELIMERQWVLDAFEPYRESVLFFMQGHTHWDAVVNAYEDGTPIIITTCDTLSTAAGAVANTVDEQAFDVVTFDYSAGTAKCVRVGRGSDRTVEL